jgi:kynurenine formamidase
VRSSSARTRDLCDQVGLCDIWELGHHMTREMPVHPNHPPFFFSMIKRHGDSYREDEYSAADDIMVMCGHHGTHIDALGHVSSHGKLHSGADAAVSQRGVRGLQTDDIAEQRPLIARGILVDVAALHGVSELEPGYAVSVRDLEMSLKRQRVSIRKGDIVLFRTGWGGARWAGGISTFYPAGGMQPGPTEEVAKWLSSVGVRAAGSDTMSFECVVAGQNRMPCHSELLFRCGIPILEMLTLEELSSMAVFDFLFVALPLRVKGATGSPIRPVALSLSSESP